MVEAILGVGVGLALALAPLSLSAVCAKASKDANEIRRQFTAGRRTAREIIEEVAFEHGLALEDLTGPRRNQRYAWARQDAYAALRDMLGDDGRARWSLHRIGQMFNRDHSTVSKGIDSREERIAAAARDAARAAS